MWYFVIINSHVNACETLCYKTTNYFTIIKWSFDRGIFIYINKIMSVQYTDMEKFISKKIMDKSCKRTE